VGQYSDEFIRKVAEILKCSRETVRAYLKEEVSQDLRERYATADFTTLRRAYSYDCTETPAIIQRTAELLASS
jgi:hypothetical protein